MFESVQCENLLKNETAKFQAVYDGFCKEKATHLQALKGTFPVDMVFCQLCHLANRSNKSWIGKYVPFHWYSYWILTDVFDKYEEEKERLISRYEQLSEQHVPIVHFIRTLY